MNKVVSYICKVAKSVKITAKQLGTNAAFCISKLAKLAFNSGVNYAKRLMSSELQIKLSAVAASFCLVAAGTVTAYGLSMNYGVSYNNKIIAYVNDKDVVDDAAQIVVDTLKTDVPFDYISEINCVPSFSGDAVSDASQVANALLDSTKGVNKCARLMIEGSTYLCATSKSVLENALAQRLASFALGGANEKVAYLDTYEIVDGYCVDKELTADENVPAVITGLSVKTISTITYTENIAYSTITQKTDREPTGYKRVTKAGVKGEQTVVANVVTVNGVEQSREIVSRQTTKQPVSQVVTVGTAKPKKVVTAAKKGMFIWPLAKAERQYISSYYGDGRGHKGWDIASPKGTNIYAAKDGTVTVSGWSTSGYGKYIIIDHGNGYSTLYSHCSELYVKAGQKVTEGQVIAAVGQTGRASGNHLHFEIKINGVSQNPASYF